MSHITSRADCNGIALMPRGCPDKRARNSEIETLHERRSPVPRHDPTPITRTINLTPYYIAAHRKFYDRDKPLAHPAYARFTPRDDEKSLKNEAMEPRTNVNRARHDRDNFCFCFRLLLLRLLQRLTAGKIIVTLMFQSNILSQIMIFFNFSITVLCNSL